MSKKGPFLPPHPRICSRCAMAHDEPWRVGCPRCGGVVVANDDRGRFFRILDRAKRDGWDRSKPERDGHRATAYQASHPLTHQPLAAFPQQDEEA